MDEIQKEMLLNLSEQVSVLHKHVQNLDKQIGCLLAMTDAQQQMINSLSTAVQSLSAAVLLMNGEEESSVPEEKHTCGTCRYENVPDYEHPCYDCKFGNGRADDHWAPKMEESDETLA